MHIQDGYAIQGKIFAVKTAKKYSSVEGCTKLALSKIKVAGFTFESKSQKCTLYKKLEILNQKKVLFLALSNILLLKGQLLPFLYKLVYGFFLHTSHYEK